METVGENKMNKLKRPLEFRPWVECLLWIALGMAFINLMFPIVGYRYSVIAIITATALIYRFSNYDKTVKWLKEEEKKK